MQYAEGHHVEPNSRQTGIAAFAALRCLPSWETVWLKSDATCRIKKKCTRIAFKKKLVTLSIAHTAKIFLVLC
jgi:hypothetical protein